jgi:hypothetical protein
VLLVLINDCLPILHLLIHGVEQDWDHEQELTYGMPCNNELLEPTTIPMAVQQHPMGMVILRGHPIVMIVVVHQHLRLEVVEPLTLRLVDMFVSLIPITIIIHMTIQVQVPMIIFIMIIMDSIIVCMILLLVCGIIISLNGHATSARPLIWLTMRQCFPIATLLVVLR